MVNVGFADSSINQSITGFHLDFAIVQGEHHLIAEDDGLVVGVVIQPRPGWIGFRHQNGFHLGTVFDPVSLVGVTQVVSYSSHGTALEFFQSIHNSARGKFLRHPERVEPYSSAAPYD